MDVETGRVDTSTCHSRNMQVPSLARIVLIPGGLQLVRRAAGTGAEESTEHAVGL